MYLIFIVIFKLLLSSEACFPAYQRRYRAAVVEYSPGEFTASPGDVIRSNLVRYGQLIDEAAKSGADVIVFPEYGLTTSVVSSMSRSEVRPYLQRFSPDPSSSCKDLTITPTNQLVSTYISCYAKQHSIYVVVNVGEIVGCPAKNDEPASPNHRDDEPNQVSLSAGGESQIDRNGTEALYCSSNSACYASERLGHRKVVESEVCPDDGAFHYNTNVVYDRRGRLIARYRKTHLFLEPGFQSPPAVDLVTFSTDFGVEFGLFTCFDILYEQPALELHSKRGIRDYVFPNAWIDELPFLTATQVQEAFARALSVNLLASGYHRPSGGQLGSGIYTSTGPLKHTVSVDSGTQLIVTDVIEGPGVPSDFSADRIRPLSPDSRFLLFEDLTSYLTSQVLHGQHTLNQCHGDLCCTFRYSCTGDDCNVYRLVTYSGTRSVGNGVYKLGIQVCGIVGCIDRELNSCRLSAEFGHLEFSGNFSTRYVYPTAINTGLDLLHKHSFQVAFNAPTVTWRALTSMKQVLAAGLYGRLFQLDS